MSVVRGKLWHAPCKIPSLQKNLFLKIVRPLKLIWQPSDFGDITGFKIVVSLCSCLERNYLTKSENVIQNEGGQVNLNSV